MKGNLDCLMMLINLSCAQFQGFVKLNGIWCSKWIAVLEAFNRTDTYIFHATDEDNPKPMRFEMNGYDVMLTSYYDHYIVDYKVFESWTYDAEMFAIPQGKHNLLYIEYLDLSQALVQKPNLKILYLYIQMTTKINEGLTPLR